MEKCCANCKYISEQSDTVEFQGRERQVVTDAICTFEIKLPAVPFWAVRKMPEFNRAVLYVKGEPLVIGGSDGRIHHADGKDCECYTPYTNGE